ncbi:non-ribosomal peptide synthetase [cf. Phormidesmis sp. LEGE 11477]|uniref:non-ribosomal peptide synthetase n=1 Tax=cf. Phormidesmis sp. LEGE 11477 TaxID=1828680 RepID=UPI001881824D|nr:non-ribosomal peptide synthetase [cf. Phormidesmis sp. LEGE 11477]MBE9060860.1 amino acid adenylation domain-containing protein [cf. Phormidesmis sp. LEGE 11477]
MVDSQISLNPQLTASLRERISALSPAQRQLFRQQLEAKGIAWDQTLGDAAETLSSSEKTPLPRPNKLPLSASQKQLWVFQQLHPDSSAYHIAFMLTLEGNLVESALQQSLQRIVNRHESLRTIFLQEKNRPYAKVLPSLELTLPIADLRDGEKAEEIEVQQWQERLVTTPFDLEQGPMLRTQLLKKTGDHFELIVVLHHLIADGWSRGILLRELAKNYCDLVENKASSKNSIFALPALTIQYADYVLQQEQWLKSKECDVHRRYWREQLANLPELNLLSDYPNSAHFASKTCTRFFSIEETNAIKTLARRSGATVFMLLLAIFKLLLCRYSNQQDIAVGVPVAGRNSAAVEPLIGFFVNTLVIRSQVEQKLSFSEWLQRVQATLSDALQHQALPFSEVIEAVGADRTIGKNPLFRVMFQVQSSGYQLQNAEQLSSGLLREMPGLSLSQQWIEPGETKFDMSWHVIERDGQLLSAVEYRTGLFEGDRIQTMLNSFHTLVAAVIATPDQKLSQYSLLSGEQRRIVESWSRGSSVQDLELCLPARFEQQVRETPDAIATCQFTTENHTQRSLTYQQLNQKANKTARWLQSKGIGSKSLVGVCLRPGTDLMASLLAVLKAGGAYVPLDPALPTERLRYMVKDTESAVIIAHRDCLPSELLEEVEGTDVLYLDTEEHLIAQPGDNLNIPIASEDLAYVIYTSGSTGKPKGTQLTHGGLINYLDWCLSAYPIEAGCGAPVQSSIGFDATITSLFAPLLAGKQVVFYNKDTEIESFLLALSGGFSFLKLTPAHLSALQPLLIEKEIERSRLPKALIIGGEALHAHHISLWREHFPEVALFNEYGPTEAVVGCCVHKVSSEDSGNIPIGKPINGVQLYVLDKSGQLVPPGAPGELHIGGVGVAKGYLNQPTLTAERFVENSFKLGKAGSAGSMLYKTGDLAAYKSDGSLEYLGRIDSQVKLRGFRIELGEIEQALVKHSQVEQATVIIREEKDKKELVGYVVANKQPDDLSTSNALTAELKQALSQVLLGYMVPTHIMVLESFPLSVNGKINYQQLPTPTVEADSQQPVKPRNQRESILLDVWEQILGASKISIYDNFFDLGGDSISGMQIVSKAREQGLKLTPAQLFQYQTVVAQAAIATETTPATAHSLSTEIPIGNISLSPIQWDLFEQKLPSPHHYNQSLLLDVQVGLNAASLRIALNALISHHDALRLRFSHTESGWTQRYAPRTTDTTVLEECVLPSSKSVRRNETIARFQSSLNIAEGPLFRGVLLRSEDDTDQLLLVAHHLVIDGVSWRILLTDLATAYAQAEVKQTISLPAKTVSFGEWINRLYQQNFEADLDYWTDVCRQTSNLPIEMASEQNTTEQNTIADERESAISLSLEKTAVLQKLTPPVDVLLLTALAQTLSQWSNQSSLVIDVERHGRQLQGHNEQTSQALDLSRTVGWFTSLYPLHLSLLPDELNEQINYVQRQLSQVPHQGISYGVLRVQHSSDGVQLNSPAEVSFNYLGQMGQMIDSSNFVEKIEAAPGSRSLDGDRPYLFNIIAIIQDGQLQVKWRYSQRQYQSHTIDQLTQRFINHLTSLIAYYSHSQTSASAQSKPKANFSAARVDTSQINQLMGKLQRRGGRRS